MWACTFPFTIVYLKTTFLTDIDECKTGQHNCSMNAKCTDVDGGFDCSCWLGFRGDGHNCTSNYFFRLLLFSENESRSLFIPVHC